MEEKISSDAADEVAALFHAEAAGLFGFARTLPGVSHTEAEDLVQVTFQAAATKWDQELCFLDHESRKAWLHSVIRNKAIDRWRSYGSRQVPSDQMDALPRPRQDPYLEAMWSIILKRCWDRIAQMPEARQRVAFLRWGLDWSAAETAEWLGIRQSTVRVHLKNARDALVAEVGPDAPFDESGGGVGEEGDW